MCPDGALAMGENHRGLVVAGHDHTAEAAKIALEAGGNAFDAAVAALWMSFVAEPCMSSAGGGGFANVMTAGGRSLIYDFFVETPKVKRPVEGLDFYPITVDFGTSTEDFHVGMGSMAVPGAIKGLFAMHEELCTLPMPVLVAPAVKAAKEGIPVDWFQRYDFELLEPILAVDPATQKRFYRDGKLIQTGTRLDLPHMADFFENLAREGVDLFYKGEFAQKLVQDCTERGGHITQADLDGYRVLRRPTLETPYKNHRIYANPMPSTGGAVIALALAEMEQLEKAGDAHAFYKSLSRLAGMQKTAPNLARELQAHWPGSADERILKDGAERRGSTTHFAVIDRDGNACAITSSNGEGAGYVVSGTDIQINNMLGEAALLPHGFHTWPEGQRLSSMMAPLIVTGEGGRIEYLLGSGGAGRIPFVITQVLRNCADLGLSLAEAILAPRLHIAHGEANTEPGFDEGWIPPDAQEKHIRWHDRTIYFGGVHSIALENGVYVGMGDDRRNGCVKVG